MGDERSCRLVERFPVRGVGSSPDGDGVNGLWTGEDLTIVAKEGRGRFVPDESVDVVSAAPSGDPMRADSTNIFGFFQPTEKVRSVRPGTRKGPRLSRPSLDCGELVKTVVETSVRT